MYNNYLPQYYSRQPNYYSNMSSGYGDEIKTVNGIQSAEQYIMSPNSRTILMDSTMDRFYLKETDAAGVAKITAYDFMEVKNNPLQNDYITREEFNQWKEQYELSFKEQPAKIQSATSNESATEPIKF